MKKMDKQDDPAPNFRNTKSKFYSKNNGFEEETTKNRTVKL